MLKLPIVEGIEPEKELSLILIDVITNRLPTDGDIVPSTPSPPKSIADTSEPEHDTPVQEQIDGEGVPPVQVHPVTLPRDEVVVAAARSHIAASSEAKAVMVQAAKNIRRFNRTLRPRLDVLSMDK